MSIDIGASIEVKLKAKREKQLADARARSKAHYAKDKKRIQEDWSSPHNSKNMVTVPRTCLKCSKDFNSKSKQNRICYDCKQTSEYQAHYDMGEIMEQ